MKFAYNTSRQCQATKYILTLERSKPIRRPKVTLSRNSFEHYGVKQRGFTTQKRWQKYILSPKRWIFETTYEYV